MALAWPFFALLQRRSNSGGLQAAAAADRQLARVDARSQRAKVPSFTMFYHVLSKIKLSFGASWQCLPGLLGYIWDLI